MDRFIFEESLQVSNFRGRSEDLLHLLNDLLVSLELVDLGILLGVDHKLEEDGFIFIINVLRNHVVLSFIAVLGEEFLHVGSEGGWDPEVVLVAMFLLEVLFNGFSEFPDHELDESLRLESSFGNLLAFHLFLFLLNLGLFWFLVRNDGETSGKSRG